jgi:predicted DNA-binding ribbon-helix-helix protein
MASRVPTEQVRRNLEIANRRTSFALEVGVWDSLVEICRIEGVSVDELCENIVAKSEGVSMASAIRTYVLEYFMNLDAARRKVA